MVVESFFMVRMTVCKVILFIVLGCVLGSVTSDFEDNNEGSLVHFSVHIPDEPRVKDTRRRIPRTKKDALRIRNEYPIQYKHTARIRGGNVSDTLNFPYMVAILINKRLWCAGTIVDVGWVLTAAHCLNYVLHVSPMKSLGRYVQVRVGSENAYDGGHLVGVAGAIRHPKFEEEPVPHADVALLKLVDNLEFTKHVNMIKIYRGMKEPFAQSFVVVSGWGATRGSPLAIKDPTPQLMSSRLKVRTRRYCSDAYELVNGLQFTADFFCASLRNGTRDACLFDAGAPAIQHNKLMGIMSFGPEQCGDDKKPAVFIKAFYFKDFVKHTIASFKTNQELIGAMNEMEPDLFEPAAALVSPALPAPPPLDDSPLGPVPPDAVKDDESSEMSDRE